MSVCRIAYSNRHKITYFSILNNLVFKQPCLKRIFLLTLQSLSILRTYKQSKNMAKNMEVPFVFGVRVEGDAFTDRREETERLKANHSIALVITFI